MRFLHLYLLLAVTALLPGCEPAGHATGLDFDSAWVRALPPGQQMTAAYGVLSNRQSDTMTLVSFASDRFADVSLHRTVSVGGVSRMQPVDQIRMEAGASVILAPGGMHLMLMAPVGKIAPGDRVRLSFISDSGVHYEFSVAVEMR